MLVQRDATLFVSLVLFFFFNDTATTEIYTLSLHDALPIFHRDRERLVRLRRQRAERHRTGREPADDLLRRLDLVDRDRRAIGDRKSTRLNSSHANISYAVFCLKKKKISINQLLFTYKQLSH